MRRRVRRADRRLEGFPRRDTVSMPRRHAVQTLW
jgi:hypothetical protein